MTLFARIDHADGAAIVGMKLRATELLIFGHPKGGTPLMLSRQTAGIDLPLKALAWQDENGDNWRTLNSASWLAQRHELGNETAVAVKALDQAMTAIAQEATRV